MKILHLISSPKQNGSFSVQLGNQIVAKLQSKYPGSTVTTRNLAAIPFPHLEEKHFSSFFTPAEARSESQLEAIRHSDEAVAQLMESDIIVMGVPMYNYTIPSPLKSWIDHVMRAGVTFKYGENGVEGLVKGKKVYLAIASGGIYSEGVMKERDFTEPYLRSVLGFIGITDVTAYRVEGVSIPGIQDTALEKAVHAVAV